MTIADIQSMSWMQIIKPSNSDKNFYAVARVVNSKDTLLISQVKTNEHFFYCEQHRFVYDLKGKCAECLARVVDDGLDAGATTCSTP